ncbi:LLM class flavin-dependent oxidoreductase [Mycobacterium colombiense]|uniref:LLM class flavin-dependent oxidoreductase n=1 Tax=Mycobacterium colombiense TaxID=339268 RepID=UPI00200B2EC7|nr:LLM class flavin-dependent oxidoreductase [Mycobacterium colombiense]MCK8646702.1 LLM class flavin-dependent oxidoreductase [Mycobacterium colombiense]
MQVGVAFAIKTRADKFEPLIDVYRTYTDEMVLAEELGFDFVSTSEHHFGDDAWSPSQLPILANVAARTSRVRLHTNIFLLPLHHPLRVSEDAATVDLLSGGRLDLVCGTGSMAEEFVAMGLDPKKRWSRFWEAMDILKTSLTGEPFTYEGKHFTIPEPVRQATTPVQQPFPLWVGGIGAKLQRESGRRGLHSQGGPVFRPEYLEGLAEAGIDPQSRNLAMFVTGHLAATPQQAWEECREGWWHWQNDYRKRTWIAMIDGIGFVPPLPALEEMQYLPPAGDPMAPLLGNPDTILEALRPMLEHGDCTHFSFAFRGSGAGMDLELARESMRLFAKECLPVLKTWGREPKTSRATD